MTASARLRQLIGLGRVFAASVHDPLSARMAERAGFQAVHLSGFAVEASLIGAPDMGIMSMAELAAHAARIADVIAIPILADIDTGFGGANNIGRTIRSMEKAGVAGVHIEDQAFPKRCPVLEGRVVVSREQAIGRIKAAVDARADPDFVIVARTDADVVSIEEAIERCNLYLEAGADMAMPALLNVDGRNFLSLAPDEQMAVFHRLTSAIDGKVMSLGVNAPSGYTVDDMFAAGYSFVMFAGAGMAAIANTLSELYQTTYENRTDAAYFERHPGDFTDAIQLMKALDLDRYVDVDRRFYAP